MATPLRLHSRQFVVARRAHLIGPDWEQTEIGHGWVLSHDPALVRTPTDRGLILGGAVDLDLDGQAYRAGRFCVVSYPWIFLDDGGLLNLYFGNANGEQFVTSSPAIAEKLGATNEPERQLVWSGMNWHPLPGSTLRGVRRLLRDQALNLSDFSVTFRPEAAIGPLASENSAVSTLCESLRSASLGVSERGRLMLGFTAGLDSRTLAAALLAGDVKFECFTHVIPGREMDVTLARRICRYLGVKHHTVGPRSADAAAVEVWRQHTLSSYDDADNNVLIGADQYRFLDRDTILVRGGIFEVGRRFYGAKLEGLSYENATGESLFRRFERKTVDHRAVESLSAWRDWRLAHDNGLDLVDAIYIDQRVGGWLAAIEQAMELFPGRVFYPANSLPAMRALVTPGPEDRKSGKLQKDTIARMAPELLRFPINPPESNSIVRRVRRRASRYLSAIARRLSLRAGG